LETSINRFQDFKLISVYITQPCLTLPNLTYLRTVFETGIPGIRHSKTGPNRFLS
jgi:hypothetical protein